MSRTRTKLAGSVCVAAAVGLGFSTRPEGKSERGAPAEGEKRRLVTKPYPRDLNQRKDRSKNPSEEFEAARKRGLTEEEVRWVVKDFMTLGIDGDEISADTDQGYYQIRLKRQEWLLDALVSGFGLSSEQKKQAAARMRELGEKDYEEFQQSFTENEQFEIDGKMFRVISASKVRELTDADVWLSNDSYLPWNLCDLDEVQKTMLPLKIENELWVWPRPGSATHDFGTEQRYENLDDPFTNQNDFISPSGKFFPLSMEQVDRIRGANTFHSEKNNIIITGRMGPLAYVKLLTAPQLMTLLLLKPDMAGMLMKELGE